METPPPKYFRLKPGGEVRLKYAYIIKCDEVMKDDAGEVTELRCSVDLESKSGGATSSRKVKGTIHWVSAAHAIDAEVRLYDRLFTEAEPDAGGDFKKFINPQSLEVVRAKCEPSLAEARSEERYQFERLGYFALDSDSKPDAPVWNRTVTLKDTWAKEAEKRLASMQPSGERRRQPAGLGSLPSPHCNGVSRDHVCKECCRQAAGNYRLAACAPQNKEPKNSRVRGRFESAPSLSREPRADDRDLARHYFPSLQDVSDARARRLSHQGLPLSPLTRSRYRPH